MSNLSILKYHRRKEEGKGEGVMEEVDEKKEKKELLLVQVWDHSYSYVSGWHELSSVSGSQFDIIQYKSFNFPNNSVQQFLRNSS